MVLFHGDFAPWNKLYEKSLFEGLTFPEGMTYEDFALVPQVMQRARMKATNTDILPDQEILEQ